MPCPAVQGHAHPLDPRAQGGWAKPPRLPSPCARAQGLALYGWCPPYPSGPPPFWGRWRRAYAGRSLAPTQKKCRTLVRMGLNSAPAGRELLSVTGQPASVGHQLPLANLNPATQDLRLSLVGEGDVSFLKGSPRHEACVVKAQVQGPGHQDTGHATYSIGMQGMGHSAYPGGQTDHRASDDGAMGGSQSTEKRARHSPSLEAPVAPHSLVSVGTPAKLAEDSLQLPRQKARLVALLVALHLWRIGGGVQVQAAGDRQLHNDGQRWVRPPGLAYDFGQEVQGDLHQNL